MSRLSAATRVLHSLFHGRSVQGIRTRRHYVRVEVWIDGHQQDCFETTSPETLFRALRAIAIHLPQTRGKLLLLGVEEIRMSLGVQRSTRSVELLGRAAAFAFLCRGLGADRMFPSAEPLCAQATLPVLQELDAA